MEEMSKVLQEIAGASCIWGLGSVSMIDRTGSKSLS